jgi:hypothetical protein
MIEHTFTGPFCERNTRENEEYESLECSHRKDAPLKRGRTLVMGDGGGQHGWWCRSVAW